MKRLLLTMVMTAVCAAGASAGTISVDINDGACVSGSGQAYPYAVVYCSIQDAITDATAGDVINVAAGTYTEQVTISQSLSLIGAGESTTTILAPTSGRVTITEGAVPWDYVIAADGGGSLIDVKIESFTIDANGQNATAAQNFTGVFFRDVGDGTNDGLYSSTVNNFGNYFGGWSSTLSTWNGNVGVVVYGTSELTIDDNAIGNYTVSGISASGSNVNVTVSGNNLDGTASSYVGLFLRDGVGTITGNTIHDHDGVVENMGIYLYDAAAGVTVGSNNTIKDNYVGLFLKGTNDATVDDNAFTDNSYRSIVIQEDSDNNVITDNTITMTGASVMNAIYIGSNSGANVIGGATTAHGNTITIPTNTTHAAHLPYVIHFATGGSNDATIQNNTIHNGARAIQIDGGNTGTYTIADNAITNDGTNSIDMSYAIGLNAGNAVIIGNTMTGTRRPLECFGAGTIQFTGNTVSGINFFGLNLGSYTGDPVVTGNAFLDFGGNGNVVWNQGSGDVDATSNWWGDTDPSDNVNNSGSGTIDYSPWWGANYVGDDHSSAWTWYTNDSIQEAVDAASSGDDINVAAGTYHNDPTNVNKQVTLLGANADVDPAGSTDRGGETILTRDDTQSGFYITASGVTINGFKLGTDTPQSSRRVNIYDGATDVTIKYNIIMNTWEWSGHGVYISPTSDRAEVSYNTIDNPYWEGIRNNGASDVVISNNTVRNVDNFPILVSGRTVISGNTVSDCKDGIRVDYAGSSTGDRVEVTGNTVSYTEYAGINITGAHAYVHNNTVHHCNYWGSDDLGDWDYASIHMEASATNCIIKGNTVYDGINGIQTWASDVTITANEIYDMGVTYGEEKVVGSRTYKNSGILVGSNWGSGDIDPTGVVIQNNSIHDNYWGLFYSADLSNGVNASGNWFGDNTPGGVAAKVSDYVDYTPWLDVGTDTEPGVPGFQGDFATLWVDDDSPQSGTVGRIQEGIEDVDDKQGGFIWVVDGHYYESVNFLGRAVAVASLFAADADTSHILTTIIDADPDSIGVSDTGSVAYFVNGEETTSKLWGFTLQNGSGTKNTTDNNRETGGAIYCDGSSPAVANCIIHSNAAVRGGAVGCVNSNPTLTNCTMVGNDALSGAGIYCNESSPVVVNSIVAFNYEGAGIECKQGDGSSPSLVCCDIYGNNGGDWVDCVAGQEGLAGNLHRNPQFCDTTVADYSINSTSPCDIPHNSCGVLIGALGAACEFQYYVCGDADASGDVDIDDVVYLINYIFSGGPEPEPYESGDADCSVDVDIDDVVYLIAYIFSGGPAPCDPDGDEVPDC